MSAWREAPGSWDDASQTDRPAGRRPRHRRARIHLLVAAALLLPLPFAATTLGQAAPWEPADDERASELVPERLRTGPYHKVEDAVGTGGFMHHYVIRSDFGEFAADSDWMLRVRVGEVAALHELQEMSRSDAFADALGASAKKTVDTVTQVVTNPVETAKGLPGGVERAARGLYYKSRKLVHKADTEIDEHQEKKTSEEGAEPADPDEPSDLDQAADAGADAAKQYSGYNSARRQLAKRLRVDPYSTNPVLQQELTRLAQAAFAANLGFKVLIPGPAVLGYIGAAYDLVWNTPASELERLNNKALDDMGMPKALRLDFFENRAFTPTTETLLVAALQQMPATAGREVFIELAIGLETEDDAWLLVRAAQILARHTEEVGALQRLVLVGNDELGHVPAGVTASGRAIVPVAFDHLAWRPGVEATGPLSSYREREIWLSGHATARARRELEGEGLVLRESALGEPFPNDGG